MIDNSIPKKVHQGRNIKMFREILGSKQEALALDLNVTQASISKLEAREEIEYETLQKIAEILNVPVEAIKNFDEDSAINVIANTFNNHDHSSPQFATLINNSPNFDPLDKIVELYERMLQQQKEMIDKLEKLIQRK
jgi:transcriptional regulator with XRE-family HTH domain